MIFIVHVMPCVCTLKNRSFRCSAHDTVETQSLCSLCRTRPCNLAAGLSSPHCSFKTDPAACFLFCRCDWSLRDCRNRVSAASTLLPAGSEHDNILLKGRGGGGCVLSFSTSWASFGFKVAKSAHLEEK